MSRWTWTLGPAVVLLIWVAAGALSLLNPIFIPALPDVLRSLGELLGSGVLVQDLVSTGWRTFVGFLGAAAIGVPLGLLVGSITRIRQASAVLIDFFRSVPGIALFPLFLLFFGIGDESKIANAVFAAGLIITVNTMYGVRNANRTRILAARTMGASRARVYFRVVFPSAVPEIVGGLRIAISISLIVIVVTEMFVGTTVGLGKRIFSAYQLFEIPEMYAAILVTGLLGYALNLLIEQAERRVIHWRGK